MSLSLFQRRHEKARSSSSILPSVDGHSKNNLIHIDLQSFLIAFPEQGANAIKHIAGTVTIANDALQG
jgi:hypothetical protein